MANNTTTNITGDREHKHLERKGKEAGTEPAHQPQNKSSPTRSCTLEGMTAMPTCPPACAQPQAQKQPTPRLARTQQRIIAKQLPQQPESTRMKSRGRHTRVALLGLKARSWEGAITD
jgi:hypothetical protein